jgi:hypothetical protein
MGIELNGFKKRPEATEKTIFLLFGQLAWMMNRYTDVASCYTLTLFTHSVVKYKEEAWVPVLTSFGDEQQYGSVSRINPFLPNLLLGHDVCAGTETLTKTPSNYYLTSLCKVKIHSKVQMTGLVCANTFLSFGDRMIHKAQIA